MSAMASGSVSLILASASPRRRELLAQIGVQVEALPVDIDETPMPGELPTGFVQRLAREKAQAGFDRFGRERGLPVLGSDTAIEFEAAILGKPESREHACEMLARLSGSEHRVHTAVAVVAADGSLLSALSSSRVWFKALSAEEIAAYVATGDADDKAGAYGIQGVAAQFICRIDGSYSGIMGLPLFETAGLLVECGLKTL